MPGMRCWVISFFLCIFQLVLHIGYASAGTPSETLRRDLHKGGQFSLMPPPGWTESWNLFGLPYVLVGPESGIRRTVISVVPTGKKTSSDFERECLANHEDYKSGRLDWLKKMDGVALEFLPVRAESWAGQTKAFITGVVYQINSEVFYEQTFFVSCQYEIYHIKSIIPGNSRNADQSAASKAIRSFRCG